MAVISTWATLTALPFLLTFIAGYLYVALQTLYTQRLSQRTGGAPAA